MSALRRFFTVYLAVAHIIATGLMALPSSAAAQAADGEPPVIEYQKIDEGQLGDTQVFSASVTDDRELATVTLHYRLGETADYDSVPMLSLAGTSIHSASVETRGSDAEVLQYYLEARDAAGNRSIQGFAFDPIERVLVSSDRLAAPAVATAVAVPAELSTNSMSTGQKVLYGVLGLVVVGAIASAAGGSGGGSDNLAADDPGTVPLRIFVDQL
jgi:hypothetical protein